MYTFYIVVPVRFFKEKKMNRISKKQPKITALYCRLSMEDGRENESMSISNQKAILKDYAEKNNLGEYVFYIDDGFTGRNLNRPGFRKMISDIEAGKIGCVVTKDLSRFSRNYIEAGQYIELYFPRKGIGILRSPTMSTAIIEAKWK